MSGMIWGATQWVISYLKPKYFIWHLPSFLFSVQSLDVQQVDVYSRLENNTNNPSHRKNPPGKVRARAMFLESSHMPWACGGRNPTQSHDLAGSKCVCSPTKRGKWDVTCTHQLGCTCTLSPLFQQNPGSCSSTSSGTHGFVQMLFCVTCAERHWGVWHRCSLWARQAFMKSWAGAGSVIVLSRLFRQLRHPLGWRNLCTSSRPWTQLSSCQR